ncbi:BRO family protein [Mammaliicoccus sciuri]|uniref:BRO-N domain-containing protein n=1 Tax=Mammaliicoccus sciuri TaxID=1296 RepID=UPI0033652541
MNELQIFNFDSNEVRTVVKNSEGYFNLNDVCKVLDIKNPRQAKSRLKQDGVITNDVIDTLGRKQTATFINESNLYKVIFQSRKLEAERFQDWVTSEVSTTN